MSIQSISAPVADGIAVLHHRLRDEAVVDEDPHDGNKSGSKIPKQTASQECYVNGSFDEICLPFDGISFCKW